LKEKSEEGAFLLVWYSGIKVFCKTRKP